MLTKLKLVPQYYLRTVSNIMEHEAEEVEFELWCSIHQRLDNSVRAVCQVEVQWRIQGQLRADNGLPEI